MAYRVQKQGQQAHYRATRWQAFKLRVCLGWRRVQVREVKYTVRRTRTGEVL